MAVIVVLVFATRRVPSAPTRARVRGRANTSALRTRPDAQAPAPSGSAPNPTRCSARLVPARRSAWRQFVRSTVRACKRYPDELNVIVWSFEQFEKSGGWIDARIMAVMARK